ncbi:hypothetical protein G4X40_03255 [Rhodococcus sp. D2-41]|uniref:Mce-associated membrane protein n=1 Tax=Speluncibacter jeojiensis TaxID=2710754 RepID=A0A9X4M1E4_9ACTN|nr:hypothetical protein [Rhodococcus sp. D2-41]MDG3009163.1 hypothetical protein [Rhodococcus sp. D2-41]MDG3016164.1 hypothetical protein [Corynebacteriales bacterium D3-21]
MPPIRRKPPTAARPAARRPKIAGAAQVNRAADATPEHAEATTPEPQAPESAAPEAAAAEQRDTEQTAGERPTVSFAKEVPGASTSEAAAPEAPAPAVSAPEAAVPETPASETPALEAAVPEAAQAVPEESAEEVVPARRRRRVPRPRAGWPLVAALLAIAVVFGAFAGVVAWKQPAKVDNVAYIDDATTTQVTASAKTIVQKIFSYDYKTIDQHAGEIKGDITPAMMDQYNKFFAPSSDAIKQDKSHVDATVDQGNIGVKMLEGDLAQVEMILNVTSSNDGVTGQGAQVPLLVNLQRSADKWTVTGLQQL